MMLTLRHLVLSAAVIMVLAGASYARGAPAENQVYISGIQVNPKRPSIVYASTLGPDSVLKSTDAGKTWSVADTGLTNPASPTDSEDLRVDALALDPRSPNVLYAGTGIGVLKTTDGARTWKLASNGIDFGRDGLAHRMYEGFIWGLAVDPVHTSRVYAASFAGVWKTNNGGATWKRVLQDGVLSLGIDPRRPETVYASAGGFQSKATRNTVYKTVDAGGSWRATGPSGLHDSYFGHPIAVAGQAPGTIYAGGSRGLFASVSQGRTWKKVLPLRRANSGVNAIALDPSRANLLYVGTSTEGVLKSVDGGQTWSARRLKGRSISAMAIAHTRPQTIYAGAYWPKRPDGQTAGMFASRDGGATWHRLSIS